MTKAADLLSTLHARGVLAPGDAGQNDRLFMAGRLVREFYAGATKDDLRAFDTSRAPALASGALGEGRKSAVFGRSDCARRLSTITAGMIPEVRDALFAVVMQDEQPESLGHRLSTYTNKSTATALGMTFLRIGLRQTLEAMGESRS